MELTRNHPRSFETKARLEPSRDARRRVAALPGCVAAALALLASVACGACSAAPEDEQVNAQVDDARGDASASDEETEAARRRRDAGADARPRDAGVDARPSDAGAVDARPGDAGAADARSPDDAGLPPVTVPVSPPMLYGVTLDTVDPLADIVAALSSLPRRPTARIVFDNGQPPSAYASAVPAIHAVSDIMGEILDSESVKSTSVSAYTKRTSDYLAALKGQVDIWEVGNEINGNWLGAASDVAAKMTGAFDVVKAAGGRTALTLYGCSDSGAAYDMFTWSKANVPARMLTGLDYVLVSYYEGDCGTPRTDWAGAFQQLRVLYPNAALGFGEVGAVDSRGNSITNTSIAGPYLNKYYGMKISTPGYVGGYFWWYFAEDMVPKTKPMFNVLSSAIAAMP